MKIIFLFSSFLLIVLLGPLASLACETTRETPSKSLKIEHYLDRFSQIIGLNGNVLITKDDTVVLSKSYGYADLASKIPLSKDSQFCIGSVTKQFTAIAILRLVQDSKLSLSDPIRKLIPDFKDAPWAEDVSVEHLLSHTSGIFEPNHIQKKVAPSFKSIDQIIDYLKNKPSISKPGDLFLYSNTGYIVLGYLIEKITSQPLDLYLHGTFFAPLEMHSTSLQTLHQPYECQKQEQTATLVSPHQYKDSGIIAPIEKIYCDIPYAAGGLISTTGDLTKWNRGLYGGEIISNSLLERFLSPHHLGYGLGITVETYADTSVIYKHGGAIDGYHSLLLYLPKQKVSICVLTNVDYNSPHRMEALMDNLSMMMVG